MILREKRYENLWKIGHRWVQPYLSTKTFTNTYGMCLILEEKLDIT